MVTTIDSFTGINSLADINVLIERQENADYFSVPLNSIVSVPFEEYVATVVSCEIGNAPKEACKAQAIAARTYAMKWTANNKPISDLSTKAQAYRASCLKYQNAIDAATETAGTIITYNDKPINAVYSSSNGGQTVSCEERWGNYLPYLISQKDPWNKAEGSPRNGHGVGMSQKGAIYAAKLGIPYEKILAFYYPNTVLKDNYGNTGHSIKLDKQLAQYFYDILKDKIIK